MAARAGATIADAEFVQFHPTAIDVGRDPAPLATEVAARRRRDADQRPRRALHARTASGRRARAARHRRPRRLPRVMQRPRRLSRLPRASGVEFAARFPTVFAACQAAGHRSAARADPGRAGRALSHGRRLSPTPTAAPRSTGSGPAARSPRPARTAPTGSPPIPCSRRSCSARASRTISPSGCRRASRCARHPHRADCRFLIRGRPPALRACAAP